MDINEDGYSEMVLLGWASSRDPSIQIVRRAGSRVIARDEGTESRYFELPGRTENAYKCSIYIENLKDNNDNILWDVSAEKPIWLWIGVDAAADLPYVLEIRIDSTPLGALKVTPKTLEIK